MGNTPFRTELLQRERKKAIGPVERSSVAALKAQLATAESRGSPGFLGCAESLRVHLGQLREAAPPGEEVALLEQELEQVVGRVDRAGALVLQLESVLRGRLAETRRDWQQLRSSVKEELFD
eukprot:Skav210787  [mRNA]  locus=scaffold275:84825:86969:+ [translate_table: standard]